MAEIYYILLFICSFPFKYQRNKKIDHPHTMAYPMAYTMAYPMGWAMAYPIFCPYPRFCKVMGSKPLQA